MFFNSRKQNKTKQNKTKRYNILLIVALVISSLISLSCSEKIHGLEKYNGNTYVSTTPVVTGGDEIVGYYYYYEWLYIENGLVHILRKEGNKRRPYFDLYSYGPFGEKMGPSGMFFKGSGTSYTYTYETYNYNPENDENIPEYDTLNITLDFSENGNSIAYKRVSDGNYMHNYETYTENLELVIFKDTGEDWDEIAPVDPLPEIIDPSEPEIIDP